MFGSDATGQDGRRPAWTPAASHIEEPHTGGGHQEVIVEEPRLDNYITTEDLCRHHLRLGRRLDQRLPRVGAVGDHQPELEEPLLHHAVLVEDSLLESELVHAVGGGEADLPGDALAAQHPLGDPRLMDLVGGCEVFSSLPNNLSRWYIS